MANEIVANEIVANEIVANEIVANEIVANEITKKKIIFVPNGRLGNAFFRYLACAIININNPSMEYILHDNKLLLDNARYTYYPGVDHEGDDIKRVANIDEIVSNEIVSNEIVSNEIVSNEIVVAYNTLGYLKHTIDIDKLKSNAYINKENGHGIYVKKTITLNDDNFFNFYKKKLEYFNVRMTGYFQFGYLYLKNKTQILKYIEDHKNEHYIKTDIQQKFLMRDLLNDINLAPENKYDIVIHLRLGDFNGRPDYIEVKYYLSLFKTIEWTGKRTCLMFEPSTKWNDCQYIEECFNWFKERDIQIELESNSLMLDFNIMKQAKILICSMSTLAWTAAYLSQHIETCYMPDYNFYEVAERRPFFFRKPIENTILYPVKTTTHVKIQPYIITLPAMRIPQLDDLNQKLSQIGLESIMYNGVNGKDIKIQNIMQYKDKIYNYNPSIRLNGLPMTRGEFGCAWSHLNLLQQLVEEKEDKYYLILEDDVELVKPLQELNALLQHIPSDMDMCHLAKSEWYPFIKTRPVNAYFSECQKIFFNKTTAYLVSKKGAQKVLDYTANQMDVPIDDLFNMIFRLTPDFRFYVPSAAHYFFKEQDNITSSIHAINQSL